MTGQTKVTVLLPDDVLRRAEVLARHTGQSVEDVLADTIELSLRPAVPEASDEAGAVGDHDGKPALADWPDEKVLRAADAQLPPAQDRRLSELLDRQQRGPVSGPEQAELTALMQAYSEALLRKARAVREAVRRGLREPPKP